MPRKPVTIGEHKFPTQKAATEYAKAILSKWWDQRPRARPRGFADTRSVPVRDRDDHDFLKALFRRHPEAKSKAREAKQDGQKLKGFSVGKHPKYGKPCLWLRTNEEPLAVPFSLCRSVRGK
jgi:hypothetical protein